MNLPALMQQLMQDEGFRAKPYTDTVGKMTIGYGRNLSDVGISQEEAEVLLQNDVLSVVGRLASELPWWSLLPEPQQEVLANMAFNMGVMALMTFHTTLGYVQAGQYDKAADSMLQSLWARQVGSRANRLAAMMRTVAT